MRGSSRALWAALLVAGMAGCSWRPLGRPSLPPAVSIHRAHAGSFTPRPERPLFFLIIGSDSGSPAYGRGGSVERGRADAIHLVGVNPARRAGTILDIPRDSYVPIPGRGMDKINSSLAYGGPELAVRTVEALVGVRVDYYFLTSFEGLVGLVDEVGGLDVRVDFPMYDPYSGSHFSPGVRHMSGAEVLAFSRDRHSLPGGDFDRSRHQGEVLLAGLARFREAASGNPAEVLMFVRAVMRHVRSDIPLNELFELALLAREVEPGSVRNVVLPGTPGNVRGASVVFLSPAVQRIFQDFRDDGLVG